MHIALEKRVGIRYEIAAWHPSWVLSDETMPESAIHDRAVSLLFALLAAFAARTGRGGAFRNLAIRWIEEEPRIGVDPDVSFFDPAPPDPESLRSIRTWVAGHAPPLVSIEVVSETNPRKDYASGPERHAASGTRELWVFDPLLAGPTTQGGPFRLQLWAREEGALRRTYAGEGPVHSAAMNAWLLVVDDGKRLRLADNRDGDPLWLTPEEEERRDKEDERRSKDAALQRVAELEALLAARH